MFKNIGKKIKGLAQFLFWFEAIAAIIAGLVMMEDSDGFSLLICLVGVIAAWVMSWFLYGFGEIIDKLCDIERNTRCAKTVLPVDNGPDEAPKVDPERLSKLKKLLDDGLITEEEYKTAVSKEA